MNKHDLDKAYVSPYDKVFHKFDQEHPMSASQLKEYLKYKRIFEMRDNPNALQDSSEIWEEF
jgi:hypothetical protein